MAIIRASRPEHHFTQLRNDVLRDDRLSYRARGVLAVILSHADGWHTSAESLARAGTEGRDAIRTALTELETAGYLVREKRQDDRGRWSTHAVLYDVPRPVQGTLLHLPQPGDNPGDNPPTTDFQASDNQPSDSQASIEDHQEHSVPTGRAAAKAEAPEAVVAKAVYDHAGGLVPFVGVRTIAARALKRGHSPEAVQAAMVDLWDRSRPITLATVGQTLEKRGGNTTVRDANASHWAAGGGFLPPASPTA